MLDGRFFCGVEKLQGCSTIRGALSMLDVMLVMGRSEMCWMRKVHLFCIVCGLMCC